MPERTGYDRILMIPALILVVFGIVMVYSSSNLIAIRRYGASFYFLKNQIIWAVTGITGMLVAMNFDYKRLRRLSLPMIIISVLLLIAVLIPHIGTEVNGAKRWVRFIGLSFQPSELAKLTMIITISAYIAKRANRMEDFVYGFFPPVVLLGLFQMLIMLQPDMGTAIAMGVMVLTLLFIGGVRIPHILSLTIPLIPFIVKILFNAGYRKKRLIAFIDPWSDPTGAGFQVIQSLLALGSGGLFGLGLGEGKQKLFFLPEPHTDFIYSLIGEELGFVGASLVIFLYLLILWRGVRIAIRIDDPFGRSLATGLTFMIGIQALINLGVVTGLLPPKGLPLPFVSFGGTALLMNMVGLGILLNISRNINKVSLPKSSTRGWAKPEFRGERGPVEP
jgi:cell division protein FtsW